ncbi:protein FAM210A [Athalia rosae]|uniref:protein FAM210A n=1 Tax=Athalia rosae TaxID=37344 RepID=UPI002033734D|nr:protein FAM210A [Athalia rosae]
MEMFIQKASLRLIGTAVSSSCTLRCLPACQRLRYFSRVPKPGAVIFDSHIQRSSSRITSSRELGTHNLHITCGIHSLRPYRFYSTQPTKDSSDAVPISPAKPNVFQKMKQMTKDYWHVLLPVHIFTSIGWMLIFYSAAKNSVDVIWIMEKFHCPERFIEALRGSSAGFWAVAYALYKIFTPLRYMVTVAGTTLGVKYLTRLGYLKRGSLASSVQKSQTEPPKT